MSLDLGIRRDPGLSHPDSRHFRDGKDEVQERAPCSAGQMEKGR